MPARDTAAQLGRSPTMELFEDGLRIEPQVSDPMPIMPKLAASDCSGAARRSAGCMGRVVRVSRKTGQNRIDIVDTASREFRHRRFGQDDCAGRSQPGDDCRIARRHPADQRARAPGRRQALDINVVLHQHRDAVKRAGQLAGVRESPIQRFRFGHRFRIEGHDAPKCRALAIIGFNSIEIAADNRLYVGFASPIRGEHGSNTCFLDAPFRFRHASSPRRKIRPENTHMSFVIAKGPN